MLKFISTDIDGKSLLSSVLKDKENSEEFFNKSSAEEIQANLESVYERTVKKEKNSTKFVNKIIEILLFESSSKSNFAFYDANKSFLDKVIQVSLINNKSNYAEHLEILIRFYYILASNNAARFYMIQKIFNFLNENFANREALKEHKFRFETVENLVYDFIKQEKNIEKKDMHSFFELFSIFVRNNKLFKNLEKIVVSGKSHLNFSLFESLFNFMKNNMNECSENICVVLFYYIFCTSSVEKANILDFDISAFEKILSNVSSASFENENKLINAITNNDLAFIRSFDFSVFNSTYGKKESEEIQKNAFLRVICNVVNKLNTNNTSAFVLPFDSMENEFKLKIEDIEEILFDGNDAGLFKLKIDYVARELKFSHMKKKTLSPENVQNIKNKISALREKLGGFINKLDLLTN